MFAFPDEIDLLSSGIPIELTTKDEASPEVGLVRDLGIRVRVGDDGDVVQGALGCMNWKSNRSCCLTLDSNC